VIFFFGFSDVKPSNILINKLGEIKLCDFGIAGELVNSFLATDIGCKPYLAPERINPIKTGAKYDQRSDVWSYGITMVHHMHSHTRTIHTHPLSLSFSLSLFLSLSLSLTIDT
jgi:serine/threonine protein kinase